MAEGTSFAAVPSPSRGFSIFEVPGKVLAVNGEL